MGGTRKKRAAPSWSVFLIGDLVSLGTYLLGQLLLTLLVVKGVLPEGRLFPAVAVSCVLAALAGALLCALRPMWGPLPSALLCGVLFAGTIASIGALCWEGIDWMGSWILLACALGGAALAGALGGGRRKRRR